MREVIDRAVYSRIYIGKLGELTLKGSNEHFFEWQLMTNMRLALEGVDAKLYTRTGRLYVFCTPPSCPGVEYALSHILGITGWAAVSSCAKDIAAITEAVLAVAKEEAAKGARSFKIEAKREDKSFPLNSYEIASRAAGPVFDAGILAVDVHSPDVVIRVEVRDECYVYAEPRGAGGRYGVSGHRGLPVGVSGKGLLLLSGGIDSPVAGYRMMRRGMKVECAYFHSYPYTSKEAEDKVHTLARTIADYGVDTHLNVIPFTDVQMKIKAASPKEFTTLMLRICMMKAANLLADRISADCIITGESLGQVASQTAQNLAVTESFAEKPVYRPLIGLDKEEIVGTAIRIGSYETSILPYEDCCVLFTPRHPVLKAKIEDARDIYRRLEIDSLVQKAFDDRKIFRYSLRDSIGNKFATRPFVPQDGQREERDRDGMKTAGGE